MTKYLIYKPKYNLYYRPDRSGYTGLKEEAGLYDWEDTSGTEITLVPEDEADEVLNRDAKNYFIQKRLKEAKKILSEIRWESIDKDDIDFDLMDKIRAFNKRMEGFDL